MQAGSIKVRVYGSHFHKEYLGIKVKDDCVPQIRSLPMTQMIRIIQRFGYNMWKF